MLKEVDSNDVKLNICKEESPGVAVAAENDGQPPKTTDSRRSPQQEIR